MNEMDRDEMSERAGVTLSKRDAAAMDAVLDGEDAAGVETARRERVEGWLKVLPAGGMPEAPGDLAQRTMAAIERERMKVPVMAGGGGGSGEGRMSMRQCRGDGGGGVAEIGAMAIAAACLSR